MRFSSTAVHQKIRSPIFTRNLWSLARAINNRRTAVRDLATYQFPSKVIEVFNRENPGTSLRDTGLALQALKEYFLVMLLERKAGRNGALGMPSALADQVWHAFLLCTKEYQAFCNRFFGQMVHHDPDPEAVPCSLAGAKAFKADVIRTWAATNHHRQRHPEFFHPLDSSEAPLLFGLDQYTSFTPGWHWTKDAIVSLTEIVSQAQGSSENKGSNVLDASFLGLVGLSETTSAGGAGAGCSSGDGSSCGSSCRSSCGGGCGGGGD